VNILKRASLNLSINAIVVLILAITMLGLGLAFINSMFGGTTEKLSTMVSGLDESVKTTLLESPSRITLLSTSIDAKKGEFTDIYFAVRNDLESSNNKNTFVLYNETGKYWYVYCDSATDLNAITDSHKKIVIPGTNPKSVIKDFNFETIPKSDILPGESNVFPLKIKPLPTSSNTVYSCYIEICDPNGSGNAGYLCGHLYEKINFYLTVK
jgi:hypothetical protein